MLRLIIIQPKNNQISSLLNKKNNMGYTKKDIIDYYINIGFDEKQANFLSYYRDIFLSDNFYENYDLDSFERECEQEMNKSGLFDIWYYRDRENDENIDSDSNIEDIFLYDVYPQDVRRYITEL